MILVHRVFFVHYVITVDWGALNVNEKQPVTAQYLLDGHLCQTELCGGKQASGGSMPKQNSTLMSISRRCGRGKRPNPMVVCPAEVLC